MIPGGPPRVPSRPLGRAAAGLAAAVLVGGCGDVIVVRHGDHPDAPIPSGGVEVALPTPFPTLAAAPSAATVSALQLRLAGGDSRPLGGLLGTTATVLAFWQTSCPPCAQELPALQAMAPALGRQGVRLLLVDLQEDAATFGAWAAGHGVGLPLYADADGSAHDALGLLGVPTSVVLGPGGGVVSRLEGGADVAGLATVLRGMGISTQ